MKATRKQQKMFFALLAAGGYDKDKAEVRAMTMFHLNSFADISTAQISSLIEVLDKKVKTKQQKAKVYNTVHVRIYDPKEQQMLYSHFAKVGHEEGVIMYFPLAYKLNRDLDKNDHIDMMLGTGKSDKRGKEIFRYDIIRDGDKTLFLIDFSDKRLQWFGINMETNKAIELYKLNNIEIIGSVYEEVKE